ncbi:uncharacterized oxidoreductase TM_0325-like [Pectinophora gossypiella]|uniref:uncharacterized oxidoreductase TM_0325-like n=1 Tax=Pectinophora gossypiella TaxID=13191 RepID=UPI00214E0972|nr:uncharacterized oxidoreductase TM_0325-like [Pectinophora gossypiella]
MEFNFKDKVVIVTGSTSGIGAAAALKFANLYAKVVIVGRNEERLKAVKEQVKNAKGIEPLAIKADVANDADVKKIVEQTIERFGRIDVLVNNAGVGGFSSLEDGIEPFDKIISTNLRSVYLLTGLVTPYLKKTKGNIINISSLAGLKPVPEFLAYSVSKAGLDMFTKCLAKSLAPDGIRVNSVNPGPVTTNFQTTSGMSKQQEDEFYKNRTEKSPFNKIATADEVADLTVFLASDRAGSITGSLHLIDNGLMNAPY